MQDQIASFLASRGVNPATASRDQVLQGLRPLARPGPPPRADAPLYEDRDAARRAHDRAIGFYSMQVTATDAGLFSAVQSGRSEPREGIGLMGSTQVAVGEQVTVLASGYLDMPQGLGQAGWLVG